jgi:acyl-[acyl carrier protein]--UDP-N-acetylglucosamine O-acyltransferase
VYRVFFRSELNLSQAIASVESEPEHIPEVQEFIDFVKTSPRGVSF